MENNSILAVETGHPAVLGSLSCKSMIRRGHDTCTHPLEKHTRRWHAEWENHKKENRLIGMFGRKGNQGKQSEAENRKKRESEDEKKEKRKRDVRRRKIESKNTQNPSLFHHLPPSL